MRSSVSILGRIRQGFIFIMVKEMQILCDSQLKHIKP